MPRASVPGEVVVGAGRDFYDFEAKYLDDGAVRLDCPADLPDDVATRARELALAVFAAVGARGWRASTCSSPPTASCWSTR